MIGQGGVARNDQQVFRVEVLGRFGEIERPGDHCIVIDDHDFAMGNGNVVINGQRDAGMAKDRRGGMAFPPMGFIKNNLDLDPRSLASTSAWAMSAEVKL